MPIFDSYSQHHIFIMIDCRRNKSLLEVIISSVQNERFISSHLKYSSSAPQDHLRTLPACTSLSLRHGKYNMSPEALVRGWLFFNLWLSKNRVMAEIVRGVNLVKAKSLNRILPGVPLHWIFWFLLSRLHDMIVQTITYSNIYCENST